MTSPPFLSVVIPVYRAEDCLGELNRRLVAALEPLVPSFEVILIEDAGGDRSYELIERICAKDNRFRGFQFSRNFGQHYGIAAGLDLSRGEWTLVMDCDLQDQPEEIGKLLSKSKEGFDIVMARRRVRQDSFQKRLGSKLFYAFLRIVSGVELDRDVAGFCLMSRKAVDALCSMREANRFFMGMVHWIGFPTAKVYVEHAPRFAGESTYTIRRLLRLARDVCIGYSNRPLRISIQLGLLISGFSVFVGLCAILLALTGRIRVPGWASVIISLYFLSGLVMLNLGILALYVEKIFDQQKSRPLYILRRSTEPCRSHGKSAQFGDGSV